MEQEEKKNILYMSYNGIYTNFYSSIERCPIYNFIFKSNLENLSLESYDGFIVDLYILENKNIDVEKLLEKIYSFNKPVILIYSSKMSNDFSELKYLEKRFDIVFEKKDSAIIEKNYDEYFPDRFNDYAISMISNKGYGRAYIKNLNNCFILRFGNITIMHDNEIERTGNRNNYVKQRQTLLMNLMRKIDNQEIPEWVNEIKILDEKNIEKHIQETENEILDLEKKKKESLIRLEENRKYKELLFTSGDTLVEIVKKVLIEMLEIEIDDIDVKKEDLSFKLNNKKILVEVKGINTAIKRENVSQAQRHIEDDARENNIEDDDIPELYKGLLIINPYIKSSIKERMQKEFYSKTVIADIEHYNICAIDTITLLGLFQKYREGEKINLKEVILNNNFVKPDFSIIQGLN